jgi:AhpD family alkylhydroperoxidase
MTVTLNPFASAPAAMKSWMTTSLSVAACFDPTVADLVKIRTSQINGCANCLSMHTAEARRRGETEQRIYLLSAWMDAPCYTDRERTALAWTDALTRLSQGHGHESARTELSKHFSDEEQVQLTLLINVINGWNRLAVGFGLWADPVPATRVAA